MSVYIKRCLSCRRATTKKTDERKRKMCSNCRWIAVAPPSMERRSLGAYHTKEQAEAAYQEAMVNRRRGIELLPTGLTVKDLVERYLRDGTAELSITTLTVIGNCGRFTDRR